MKPSQDNPKRSRSRRSVPALERIIERQRNQIETLRTQRKRAEAYLAFARFPYAGNAPAGYRELDAKIRTLIAEHVTGYEHGNESVEAVDSPVEKGGERVATFAISEPQPGPDIALGSGHAAQT